MSSSDQKYQEAVERLNPAQRQAVEHIEGPLMVVAGPGTGKTQVLALRIGAILKSTDTQPESVLVLTFTDAAAANMRSRLTQLLGPVAYRVRITTFHGLCQQVISEHPEILPMGDGTLLTDIERFSLLETALSNQSTSEFLSITASLRPVNAPLHYVPSLISAFSDLKREGFDPSSLSPLIAQTLDRLQQEKADTGSSAKQVQIQTKADKLVALEHLYAWYADELKRKKKYDFDDMVLYVLQAFTQYPEIAVEYQEQFQYLMVDEFQDTNSAQARVLESLCSFWGEQANVCVVGDPHQSIFRFQGASTENVMGFVSQFPDARVIVLETGYRCHPDIYHKAHALITHNSLDFLDSPVAAAAELKKALQLPLHSSKQTHDAGASAVRVVSLASSADEAQWLSQEIGQLISGGVPANEIAVLYRTHKESDGVCLALSAVGIGWWREGARDVSREPVVAQLILFLRVLSTVFQGLEPQEFVQLLLCAWTPLEPQKVIELQYFAKKHDATLWHWSQTAQQTVALQHLPAHLHPSLIELGHWTESLRRWSAESAQQSLYSWWLKVLSSSGYFNWVGKHTAHLEQLKIVQGVLARFGEWCSEYPDLDLPGLLLLIDTLQQHKLPLSVDVPAVSQDSLVCLTTAHRAKGREWQYVFVVGAVDGSWGGARSRQLLPFPDGILRHTDAQQPQQDEDSRRLWYVALTRAKEQCVFSFSQTKMSSGRVKEQAPSVFVYEMGCEPQTVEPITTSLLQGTTMTPDLSITSVKKSCELLLQDFVLSNAALTDYLHDPQQFFLHRLLKIPRPLEESAQFGVCVHATLEKMLRPLLRAGKLAELEGLQSYLFQKLTESVSHSPELSRRLSTGKELVERVHSWYSQHPPLLFGVEQSVGTHSKPIYFSDIALTGRLDRVDWADAQHTSLIVIDYKTGKPKGQAALAGPTQSQALPLSARELSLPVALQSRYRRQLLFYALLVELDARFPASVSQGQFIFVEGEATARQPGLVTRSLPVVAQELELMKQLITQVMQEIRSLSFLDTLDIW